MGRGSAEAPWGIGLALVEVIRIELFAVGRSVRSLSPQAGTKSYLDVRLNPPPTQPLTLNDLILVAEGLGTTPLALVEKADERMKANPSAYLRPSSDTAVEQVIEAGERVAVGAAGHGSSHGENNEALRDAAKRVRAKRSQETPAQGRGRGAGR